ncbi:hypothetical protein FALCPG4_014174 [Fusarium falciforme]
MTAATAMMAMAGTDMPAARIGIVTAPVELPAAPQVVTNVSDTTAKATATPPRTRDPAAGAGAAGYSESASRSETRDAYGGAPDRNIQ